MPEEFDRHGNQLIISKIIKTKNLSDDIAQEFINYAFENNPYKINVDEEVNSRYGEGYSKKYVLSYKRSKDKNQIFDKDLNELITKDNKLISKLFKNTFIIKQNDDANEKFIDTIILPNLNLICIIGSEKFINRPQNELYSFLEIKDIEFQEINFEHDFLLWMLWKLYVEENLSENISLDSFENLKVGVLNGDNLEFDDGPTNIKTEGPSQNLPSLPICYGLFKGRTLNYFRGQFSYNENQFVVSIFIVVNEVDDEFVNNSKLHLLSRECLEDLHFSDKLELALPFINEFANLFLDWLEFDGNSKYPDDDYLDELFEKAQEDFNETTNLFTEFKQNYVEKRNFGE